MHQRFTALVTGISTTALTCAIALSGSAAHGFTLSSSSGTWTGTDGGLFVATPTVGGENQVRWGNPATNAGQSGLGFTGVGRTTFTPGEVFQLGTLRHFNNPIWGGSAASAAHIVLDLVFADIGTQQFDFTLEIDETPNSGTCSYFSVTPCADKISWNTAFASNSFRMGNTEYTLELRGFSETPEGAIVSDFISQEGGTSKAYLFAQLSALESPISPAGVAAPAQPAQLKPPASQVPEPTTIAGSLLGLLFAIRYRNKQSKA